MPAAFDDTHCQGAGLSRSTKTWGTLFKRIRQFEGFGLDGSVVSIGASRAYPPRVDLRGKNVLISGANSGIGLEAALTFATWGAHVVMACRSNVPPHETKPEEARQQILDRSHGAVKPEQIEVWELDLSSFKSAEACGQRWLKTGKPLDILVNNAGLSSPKFVMTEDGVELTRSVNYLAHCLLTLVVLPAIKAAEAPRIVNTCSCFHYQGTLDFSNMDYEKSNGQERGPGGVQAYCDTKLYHLMWTKELQDRLSYSDAYRHVIVNGVHPGFIGSNIWNAPGLSDLMWPQPQLLNFLVSKISVPTQQGSLCILYGALHPRFGLRPSVVESERATADGQSIGETMRKGLTAKAGGHYISRDHAEVPRPECFDRLARARLWLRTLQDIKAEERGLGQDLPENPSGV